MDPLPWSMGYVPSPLVRTGLTEPPLPALALLRSQPQSAGAQRRDTMFLRGGSHAQASGVLAKLGVWRGECHRASAVGGWLVKLF